MSVRRIVLVVVSMALVLSTRALAQGKRIDATGRRYALIVGVRRAEIPGFDMSELPDCLIDAANMADVLGRNAYECRTVSEESGEAPTLANVRRALGEVCAKAGPGDLVAVYMSSHGGAPLGKPVVALADAFIEVEEVKRALSTSKALVRVVFLDCCRSMKGFATESSEFRDVHVVLGCRPDETSNISPRGGSIFTEVLVEALRDCKADRVPDGKVELDEVLYYLDAEVPRRAMEDWGEVQNPTRTVVDPRAVNPVLGTCGEAVPAGTVSTIGTLRPVRPGPSNDLILGRDLVGRMELGMTPAELFEAAGRPMADPRIGERGEGFAFYSGPGELDETVVSFESGRVSRVEVRRGVGCAGAFDAADSTRRFHALTAGMDREAMTNALNGQTPEGVFRALGCPWASLRLDEDGRGNAHFRGVPHADGWLDVFFVEGIAAGLSASGPLVCEEARDLARARAGFADLVEDGKASERLVGVAWREVIEAMGCPGSGFQTLTGQETGWLTYRDVPTDGCELQVSFSDGEVWMATLERVVGCARGFDAAFTREAFARVFGGREDAALGALVAGMTPEQVLAFMGCPAEPLTLDETGFGVARYFGIPLDGDATFVIFREFKGVDVSVERVAR